MIGLIVPRDLFDRIVQHGQTGRQKDVLIGLLHPRDSTGHDSGDLIGRIVQHDQPGRRTDVVIGRLHPRDSFEFDPHDSTERYSRDLIGRIALHVQIEHDPYVPIGQFELDVLIGQLDPRDSIGLDPRDRFGQTVPPD